MSDSLDYLTLLAQDHLNQIILKKPRLEKLEKSAKKLQKSIYDFCLKNGENMVENSQIEGRDPPSISKFQKKYQLFNKNFKNLPESCKMDVSKNIFCEGNFSLEENFKIIYPSDNEGNIILCVVLPEKFYQKKDGLNFRYFAKKEAFCRYIKDLPFFGQFWGFLTGPTFLATNHQNMTWNHMFIGLYVFLGRCKMVTGAYDLILAHKIRKIAHFWQFSDKLRYWPEINIFRLIWALISIKNSRDLLAPS